MRLYFKYLKMHLKSALQYKKSFILSLIAQIFVFFTYYFVIISLFGKFNNIKGFTVFEVLLTFSVIQLGHSLTESLLRGLDQFDDLIVSGEYDRILLKPRNELLQVLGYKIEYSRLMKSIQAIIILVISLINLNVTWNIYKIITLILMILSSILIFAGILLLMASYCFLTVQGLEVRNLFIDGGKEFAQYPIGIFKKGFIFIFTFIIPFAFVNYYPLLYILDRVNNGLYILSPLLVIPFVIISYISFKLLSKKYISTGS